MFFFWDVWICSKVVYSLKVVEIVVGWKTGAKDGWRGKISYHLISSICFWKWCSSNSLNMRKKNMSTDHLQYLMCVCVFFSQKMCNSQVIWKLKGHGYYNMPLTWLRAFIFVLFSRLCVDDVFGPRTPNCSFMFFHVLSLCDIVMSHTCSPFLAKLGWVRERSWLGITNCSFTIPGTWGETRMSCRQRFKTR